MLKYLLELKNRFFLVFLTWFSVILVGYFYKETLLFLFLESEVFVNNEFKVYYFIFTDVIEVFSVYIKLILFISFQFFFFFTLYHIFVFLSYGLFIFEYFYLNYVIQIIIIIWIFSIILSKYLLIPMMWEFFFNFQKLNTINLHFEAKLSEYLDFYIKFYYIFIFYCQIFIVFVLLLNYLIADLEKIKKFRKLFYFFFVVFATLISPPEIFSQILISLILILFYEWFLFCFIFKYSTSKFN